MYEHRKFLIDDLSPTEVLQVKRMYDILITMSKFEKETMENMEKVVEAIRELKASVYASQKQEEEIQGLKMSYIEMKGDILHIKDRIDNGISPSLSKISDSLNLFLPKVNEHTNWIDGAKRVSWFLVATFIGGLITFGFWVVKWLIEKNAIH